MLIFHPLNTKSQLNLFGLLFSILLVLTLSGCLTTTKKINRQPQVFDYSHYYLWLKELSESELLAEISIQKELLIENKLDSSSKSSEKTDAQSHTQDMFTQAHAKIMLLHSLPNSPIYQPYAAKTLLNNAHDFHNKNEINLKNNNEVSTNFHINNSEVSTNFHINNSEPKYNLAFMMLLKDQLNAQLQLLKTQAAIETKAKQRYATQNAVITQLEKQLQQLKKIEENLSKHQELNK